MKHILFLLLPIVGFSQSDSQFSTHVFPGIKNWEKTIDKASKENKIVRMIIVQINPKLLGN